MTHQNGNKLEAEDVRRIRRRLAGGAFVWEVARDEGLSERAVVAIRDGEAYAELPPRPPRCPTCGSALVQHGDCLRCELLDGGTVFSGKKAPSC